MAKIKQNIIILLILSSLGLHAQQLILGSERMEEIINSIDNKNLAIVGNQTSLVNDIHLVDTLISLKQNIVSVSHLNMALEELKMLEPKLTMNMTVKQDCL